MGFSRINRAALGVAVALTTFCLPLAAIGQIKYTPNHPEVEAMVRRAIDFMEQKKNKKWESGELTLAALAIVEASKRYESMIPVDHPFVQKAIQQILSEFEVNREDRSHILNTNAIYYPSLALILLCDVGDEQYKSQIKAIIDEIVRRQQSFGGFAYLRQPGVGDTSQSQYAGLALWVAKFHRFNIPLEVPQKILDWYVSIISPAGTWYYNYQNGQAMYSQAAPTMSIHAASAGTVYLLSDLLQLNPKMNRGKNGVQGVTDMGLPPSVSLYLPPKDGDDGAADMLNKDGPLVRFDTGRLGAAKRACSQYFADHFTVEIDSWNYYYLYAMERYAFFRERAEGQFKEVPDWYDQGVAHLQTKQGADGGFERGSNMGEGEFADTSFAILFLVRSSELLIMPSNSGGLNGGQGLMPNQKLVQENGNVKAIDAVKGIEDVMTLLKSGTIDENQTELILDSLGPAITQFSSKENKSRGEQMAFLRGLVTDKNYFRRLIAIKLLARQQDIEVAPALIYALGDPDVTICAEAQNGLRLVSRKLDSITVPPNANLSDYQAVKQQWTAWYLKIRPGAELLD